ncbi:RNA 2'-phosphotransferase, partial [archaeon]
MEGKGGKRKGDEFASEEVKWSKKLSWALRHHAPDLGLNIDSAGFVSVEELLSKRDFRGLSFDLLQRIVDSNAKKRFELVNTSSTSHDGDTSAFSALTSRVRAVQGHSIKVIDDDSLLTPIVSVEDLWVKTSSRLLVHGTYRRHLGAIRHEGLRSMGRNHIHLAIHLPRRHAHLLADGAEKSKEEG